MCVCVCVRRATLAASNLTASALVGTEAARRILQNHLVTTLPISTVYDFPVLSNTTIATAATATYPQDRLLILVETDENG